MSELPSTWVRAPIGDLCELINGRAFKPSDWTQDGLPIVRIQNLNNPDAKFNRFDGEVRPRFLIDSGQLLFAWSGTPGTSFGAHVWQGGPAVLNQHIFKVDFDEADLNKAFFRYAINQKLQELIDKAHGGVGLAHVTKGKFEETEIQIPPRSEQDRIVLRIDNLGARSARTRQELDCIPRLIQRYRQALLAKACSGELTADWRNARRLPLWKEGPSEPYFKWTSGKFLPKDKQNPGEIPVYGGNGPNGRHDTPLLTRPTLVIGRVGAHCGNVHLTSGPAWVTDNAIYASEVVAEVDPRYALLVFRSANLNSTAGGSGQPFVNQTLLNETEFPLPDLTEQQEIIRLVDVASAWLDKIAVEHARAEHLLPKLDQAILAKAFRGELVPQDPNDEPATELLERIRATRKPNDRPRRRRAVAR